MRHEIAMEWTFAGSQALPQPPWAWRAYKPSPGVNHLDVSSTVMVAGFAAPPRGKGL